RVGIDRGTGGTLGPIFGDGSFEYIPIPEARGLASEGTPTYGGLKARSGGSLARFVPDRIRGAPVHHDPEFEAFTYGDPTRNKRGQLLKLAPGDLLAFYAALQKWDEGEHAGLYLIGYFTVLSVYNLPDGRAPRAPHSIEANAHLRRSTPDRGLVVVKGERSGSRLLRRAIRIAEPSGEPIETVERVFGYRKNLRRAIGRWVPRERASGARAMLEAAD
ncbi:MAG: hypothetical protein ACE5H5_05170, partial [Nitrospinota bacterium]